MYIQPNSNIRILHNVPCDKDYTNTLFFNSLADQTAYFIGQTRHNLGNQYFARMANGLARVEVPIGNMYDCNYLMFQNTSFSNKWFYAFITNVEYVNNVTTEITFELDEMQSWFFDYTMQDVFVEREHTLTDNIGDNIVPESFNLGEYVTNSYEELLSPNGVYIMVAYIPINTTSQISGQIIDGVFQACALKIFPSTTGGVNGLNSFLQSYLEKPDNIQSIYTIPSWAYAGTVSDDGTDVPYGDTGDFNYITVNPVSVLSELDGYRPRNKKLYTYPYNFYQVDNASGQSLTLRYEFFDQLTPHLVNFSSITQPVASVIRATGYKNTRTGGGLQAPQSLNTESLVLSNFPQCSWVVDSYDAWCAQQALPLAIGTGGAIATLGLANFGSIHSGSNVPIFGAIGATGNAFLNQYQASIKADTCKGILTSGNANIGYKTQNFFGGRFSIENSMARQIDDFFDLYGYALREVKQPNRNYRPHWNYVKTIGCQINASFPYEHELKINNIYDKGIRFWRNPSEVGNYSLDNSPV